MDNPEVVERPATRVVGLAIRTTNAAEADPATARIPGLWRRVLEQGVLDGISGRTSPGVLAAVYTAYDSDERGRYTLMVGAEVYADAPTPPGLTTVAVPAARTLRFAARGPMPAALVATWGRVWSTFAGPDGPRRAFTCDLERHTGPEAADIYVAIR
jgi:predicted transcriptional regulator YdeE